MINTTSLNDMKYVYKISLDSFEKINQFINTVDSIEGELYLYSEGRIILARSIMGIFTLNLLEPILFYSEHPVTVETKFWLLP